MNKSLLNIVAVLFLLSSFAYAIDKPASSVKANAVKTNIVKAAKMHATGKVIEISGELIKIERALKGDIETMEFALEKTATDISISDMVKIDYVEKDGRLIASKISKVTLKNKGIKPADMRPVPGKK